MLVLDYLVFEENVSVSVLDKRLTFVGVDSRTDARASFPNPPDDLVRTVKDNLHISGNLKNHYLSLYDAYSNTIIQFLRDSDNSTKYKKIITNGIANCPILCSAVHQNMMISDTDFDGILEIPIEMITSFDVLGSLVD